MGRLKLLGASYGVAMIHVAPGTTGTRRVRKVAIEERSASVDQESKH